MPNLRPIQEEDWNDPEPAERAENLPERRLWAACVENAIKDAMGRGLAADERRGNRRIKIVGEARSWLLSEDTREFGFVWCLDILDLAHMKTKMRVLARVAER